MPQQGTPRPSRSPTARAYGRAHGAAPPRPTVKNPDTSFTGDVWLTPVHSGTGPSHLTAALVRFGPGARTHWHRHDVGQTLHVSDGVGLVVIVPFAWSDGTCAFCRDGITTSCVHGGFFDGAPSAIQAELLVVPQADGTAVKIPAGTDEALMPSLLTLSDVYLTGYHAPRQGQVGPGRTVTVIGDGAVGLSAVLASKELGAETIILMGRHTARTDLGRRFGATHVVAERGDEGVAVRQERHVHPLKVLIRP